MKVFMKKSNFLNLKKVVVKSNKEVYCKHRTTFKDELFNKVIDFIKDKDYISIAKIQQEFSIGYPRAHKIMQQLIKNFYVREELRYKVDKGAHLKYSVI